MSTTIADRPLVAVEAAVRFKKGHAEVELLNDGRARIRLVAIICGIDVTGRLSFDADGTVAWNDTQNSFFNIPLKPHVLRAVETRGRDAWKRALADLTEVLAAHQTTRAK